MSATDKFKAVLPQSAAQSAMGLVPFVKMCLGLSESQAALLHRWTGYCENVLSLHVHGEVSCHVLDFFHECLDPFGFFLKSLEFGWGPRSRVGRGIAEFCNRPYPSVDGCTDAFDDVDGPRERFATVL